MKFLTNRVINAAAVTLALLLILLPFHALFTVWIGSALGLYDTVRLWKELVLALLVAVAGGILIARPALWHQLRRHPLFWLAGCYVALHLMLGVWALATDRVNLTALLYALTINLRLVVIFFVAWVIASRVPWLRRRWDMVLLAPAMVVIVFGLLQAWALPPDFLTHVGYGTGTITPYQTVDQKPDFIRLQSTLRGANPLGAYLVVVMTGLAGLLLGRGRRLTGRLKVTLALMLLAASLVLALTYSRSAYVGVILSIVLLLWLALRSGRARQTFVIAGSLVLALTGLTFSLLRDNNTFQNIFFHTDETSLSATSSNAGRAEALESGVDDVIRDPLGRGPGSAGPASQHNNHPVRLAENYYLQIGQEVGWLGMSLFIAMTVVVAYSLWVQRGTLLPKILLASLVGVSVINLLSHAWTDDTLAYIWWGLAGIALANPAILTRDETH